MSVSSPRLWFVSLVTLCAIALAVPGQAQERFKPYRLASAATGEFTAQVDATRAALSDGGFEVVGEYSPYAGAHVIAVTHPALLEAAASTQFGGYAAVIRVGITEVDGAVQRSYANPAYWGQLLHVGDLAPVSAALEAALGAGEAFGSEKGLDARKLGKYRYMMMMPRLGDHDELGSFTDHATGLATIRERLARGGNGLAKVFEVAVPGTEQVLFGVAIAEGDGADATVMAATDGEALKHTAHLPYALLLSGDTAYALAGKFRIAAAFPDLSMGTFMKISGAPAAIRDSLATLVSSD